MPHTSRAENFYDKPAAWKELYEAALIQRDPQKLPECTEQARGAIMARINQLLGDLERLPEHDEILQALNNLSNLESGRAH